MSVLKSEQALLQLQIEQPANWKLHLQLAKQAIFRKKRERKLGTTPQETADAVHQCLVDGSGPANYILAAGYLINKQQKLLDDHQDYELRTTKIASHLQKLETIKLDYRNKVAIRQYYQNWLVRYGKKINRIIAEIRILERDFKYRDIVTAMPLNGYRPGDLKV